MTAELESLHVHQTPTVFAEKIRRRCPVCKRRTTMIVEHSSSPWYAGQTTCLGCGDRWAEGMLERPFRRGWREESKASARRAFDGWRRSGTIRTYDELLAYYEASMSDSVA